MSEHEKSLIGRDIEIDSFKQVLKAKASALVIVTSEPRMGKSTLLQAFGQIAKEAGWCVIGAVIDVDNPSEALVIDWDTTEQSFHEAILTQSPRESTITDTLGQSAAAVPSIGMSIGVAKDASSADLRATNPPDPPKVILVDRYHPNPEFEMWFARTYIATLKQNQSPIIVVVAAYPADGENLTKLANRTINLGSIPEGAIRQQLRQLNENIILKMKSDEMNAYIAELSKNPDMIGPLTRLLQLELSGSEAG